MEKLKPKKKKQIRAIAVYGTLRLGDYNYQRFAHGLDFIGQSTLTGYKMYNLGGYPCIVETKDKDDTIIIDIMRPLTSNVAQTIDAMESGARYEQKIVKIKIESPCHVDEYMGSKLQIQCEPDHKKDEVIECKIYTFPKEEGVVIESGDWFRRNEKPKRNEYVMEDDVLAAIEQPMEDPGQRDAELRAFLHGRRGGIRIVDMDDGPRPEPF